MALDREQIANWDEAPAYWRVKSDKLVVGPPDRETTVPAACFGELVLDLIQAMQNR